MTLHRGDTSQTVSVRILDTTSVTGGGKTGLTSASSGLTAYYKRQLDSAATAITLASGTLGTYVNQGGAGSGGGFVELATPALGIYEISLPNAAISNNDASHWAEVMIYDSGTGLGIAPSVTRFDLWAADPQDAVRLGLTALPNAAAEAAGGLYTRGSNAGQINQPGNGLIDVSLKAILNTVLTETSGLIAAAFKKFFNVASPTSTMNKITLVDTTTNLTNASGDPWATVLPASYGATQAGGILSNVQTKTDTIGSATLTFNSPSITGGTEPLVANRSYKNAYGNAITFTVSNLSVSLLTAGITTSLRILVGTSQAFEGVATSASAGYVEVDAELTEDWAQGTYQTEFVVSDSGDDIHIVSGTIDVSHGVG